MAMRFIPGNAQDVGSRADQQDSFGFSDPDDAALVAHGGLLAVLADGMGGLQHGHAASSVAVKTMLDAYRAKTPQESIPQALERALLQANDVVLALAEHAGAEGNVGATLVAAVLHESALHWISVGDSELFLFRDGSLWLLTSPHVYASELDASAASGKIAPEEARNDPQRQALTSYLGLRGLREIDRSLRPLPLQARDRVVLACDGLFKTLSLEEIASELAADPQQACEALVRKTLAKHLEHQDNITVLSLAVEEEIQAAPPPESLTAVGRRPWGTLVVLALLVLLPAMGWRFTHWNRSRRGDSKSASAAAAGALTAQFQGVPFEFVRIPAGEFQMGSDQGEAAAKPAHKVRITREFQMSKLEVPQVLWQKVMGTNPSGFPAPDHPVEKVSFDGAQQFVQKLNQQNDGFTYRLPTEAEWEYAARAGAGGDAPGSLDLSGWFAGNSGNQTHPVGGKQPNAWGLHDLMGNVREWCQDWYDENYYATSPQDDPPGPASGSKRVVRGGGWSDDAAHLHPAFRSGMPPDTADPATGFRLVRTPR